jgi:hypothetical protein
MKKQVLTFMICVLLVFSYGCINQKFQRAYSDFKSTFLDTTQFLDDYKESSDAGKADGADFNVLKQGTKDLSDSIKLMQAAAGTNSEKYDLQLAQYDYDALIYILEYKKGTDPSIQDNHDQLNIHLSTLEMDRDYFLGRKSN